MRRRRRAGSITFNGLIEDLISHGQAYGHDEGALFELADHILGGLSNMQLVALLKDIPNSNFISDSHFNSRDFDANSLETLIRDIVAYLVVQTAEYELENM